MVLPRQSDRCQRGLPHQGARQGRAQRSVAQKWFCQFNPTCINTGKGELTTYWLCGKDDYDRPLPEWDAEDGPSHGLKIDDYLNVSHKVFNFCIRTLKRVKGERPPPPAVPIKQKPFIPSKKKSKPQASWLILPVFFTLKRVKIQQILSIAQESKSRRCLGRWGFGG